MNEQINKLLSKTSFACISNGGYGDVTIRFRTLEEAQEFHRFLVENRKAVQQAENSDFKPK